MKRRGRERTVSKREGKEEKGGRWRLGKSQVEAEC